MDDGSMIDLCGQEIKQLSNQSRMGWENEKGRDSSGWRYRLDERSLPHRNTERRTKLLLNTICHAEEQNRA